MKILHVITRSEQGGAQMILAYICNALCDRHEVMVIAGEGDGKLWKLLDDKIKKITCTTIQRSISISNDIKSVLFLKKMYKKYSPDIIHLHSSKIGILGRLAFPRSKTIYTIHGFDSIRLVYKRFLLIEKIFQYFCSYIIAISNYDYDNLLKAGISRNVVIIYNGTSVKKQNEQKLDIFKNTDKRRVLCIARLAPPKRDDIFVETARLLPQYDFYWVGNDKEIKEPLNNVHFVGNIVNASSYINEVDLLVLPSDYEGMPMTIIEAMNVGRPIVSSNVGAISELIKNGVNGYLVENDAKEFALKIDEILSDDNKHRAFSNASTSLYKEKFTSEIMTKKYLELYNMITSKQF